MTKYEVEILKKITLLEKSQQNNVLLYIKSLLKGHSKKNLLKFAGIINPEDIKRIESAIQSGCESIDKNEW